MRQQCSLVNIYLNWLLYLAGAGFWFWRRDWVALVVWVISLPVFMVTYLRVFPKISRFLGYGEIKP